MEDCKNLVFKLYVHNYYSSPDLFGDLFKNGIAKVGTLQVNKKGIPKRKL